uniref:BLOC-1-related complex subunit 7 n=1 Tax=Megaselia scalaris TaxID=36166 RepID=T1H0Q3_MEGSC
MTSASSSSAKHLFADSKNRLAERVNQNVSNIGSVARQIVRGSKSNEILGQAAKHMAQCETLMDNTATTLHKIELIRQHIGYQHEAIQDSIEQLDYLQEQVTA